MTDEYSIPSAQAWFEKAARDIRSADVLLQADPPETESAAFHGQQAVEKYLKGVLAFYTVSPPRIHDIGALMDQVHQYSENFEPLREAGSHLSVFAVEVRYPYPESPPSAEEAAEALETAKEFQKKAEQVIQGY